MKKVLSIILLAALSLSLAACNKAPDSSGSLTSGGIAYDENGNVVSSEHDHDHDHSGTGSAAVGIRITPQASKPQADPK